MFITSNFLHFRIALKFWQWQRIYPLYSSINWYVVYNIEKWQRMWFLSLKTFNQKHIFVTTAKFNTFSPHSSNIVIKLDVNQHLNISNVNLDHPHMAACFLTPFSLRTWLHLRTQWVCVLSLAQVILNVCVCLSRHSSVLGKRSNRSKAV